MFYLVNMYIKREIKEGFLKRAGLYSVTAVVGARQAGKTTFLKEQIKTYNGSYVLFDDPDVREIFEEDIKRFDKQYLLGYDVSILDELQYCKDAGRKIKFLADSGKKLWITSSSEIILSKKVLSYLVGRVSIIRLFPFSLTEFLSSKNIKAATKKIMERSVWEHMNYGGYPKVVLTDEFEMKKVILKDIYDTLILKDVAFTFSIDDFKALEELTKLLSINTGSMLSYDSLSNSLNISFQTLKKYLDALEKSYVILRILPYYTNKNKEIAKQPKVYFIDTGLRNIISKGFDKKPDGRLFENYVFSELIKMGIYPKYWRTKSKAEVDFVVEDGKELIPIEVKLKAGKVERSLTSFIEAYKPKKAIIVCFNGTSSEKKVKGCRVIFTDVLGMKDILNTRKIAKGD